MFIKQLLNDGNIWTFALLLLQQLLTFLPVVQSWKMTQAKFTQDEMEGRMNESTGNIPGCNSWSSLSWPPGGVRVCPLRPRCSGPWPRPPWSWRRPRAPWGTARRRRRWWSWCPPRWSRPQARCTLRTAPWTLPPSCPWPRSSSWVCRRTRTPGCCPHRCPRWAPRPCC